MTVRMDANMLVGRFPFRAVARSNAAGCLARMNRLGFDGAIVSPMAAIFQEDSYEAEARLADDIAGKDAFLHFKVVHPLCSWWYRDVRRALEQLGIEGIRLCPTFHDYKLTDAAVDPVMAVANEKNVPVLVMCRMQDYRMQWMLRTREPDATEVEQFLERNPYSRLILAGLHFADMQKLAECVTKRDNVLVDTSRLKGPWKTFEKLTSAMDPARLAFGSLWPINLPDCPYEQIVHAAIPDDAKAGILGGNLARLLNL